MASIFAMRAWESYARRKAGNPYGSVLEEIKGDQRKATNETVKALEENKGADKENERRDAPKANIKEMYDFIDNLPG